MFSGKRAIVTGAASGVGRTTALMFAGKGAAVSCLDRRPAELERVVAEIEAGGGCAQAVECDLAAPDSITTAFGRCLDWREGIDVLAHVAGIGLRCRVEDVDLARWQQVLDVNLRAPLLLSQAAIEPLVAAGGNIVAVSSLAGLGGWPYNTAYAASKGGLVTMMKSLALELGPRGVRVNVVCPGGVETPMLDALDEVPDADPSIAKRGRGLDGSLARPEEVAAAICWLASTEAGHVSGTTLTVDGGAGA